MRNWLIIYVVLSSTLICAQTNTGLIYGNVKDEQSNQAIFGASVSLYQNGQLITGVSTDYDGHFELQHIPVGRYTAIISYIGYDNKSIDDLLIQTGKDYVANILLSESQKQLNEVVVKADKKFDQSTSLHVQNEMATVSAMSFSLDQSTRYAASLNDPSRLVLSFPGVRNQGDVQTGISIRGNTPTALLWNIEGLEVQSPNHFAREGSLGAVNMLSSNMMQSVDFYTASFPAQYGNAGSGVFDLKLRNGNSQKHRFSLSAGIMGLETSAEGPFSKKYKGSFLISYRYSTFALINKMGYDVLSGTSPVYQDFNAKIHLPTKKMGDFNLFSIVGDSYIEPFPGVNDDPNFTYSMWIDKYRLALLGINNQYNVSKKTSLLSSLLFSQSKGYFFNEWGFIESFLYKDEYPLKDQRLQFDIKTNTKISAKHSFQSGFNLCYQHYSQSYTHSETDFFGIVWDSINNVNNFDTTSFTYGMQGNAKTVQLKAFMQHRYQFAPKATLIAGIHALHMQYNKFTAIEPRLGLEYSPANFYTLSLGAGLHSRLESLGMYSADSYYFIPLQNRKDFDLGMGKPNQFLSATRSVQFVVGNTFKPFPKWQFKAELYTQYLYDIPTIINDPKSMRAYATVNFQYPSIYDYDLEYQIAFENGGKGLNYGLDLSIEKAFSKNYYLLLNGSLYNSLYRTPYSEKDYGVKWLNTRYNGKFILNFTGGKDFKVGKKKNNLFSLNTRVIWSGNNRKRIDKTLPRNKQIPFAYSLKNYFRWDSRIAYIRNKAKYSWTLSVDLQNMTNRKNEASNKAINNVGILPVLNYKVQF